MSQEIQYREIPREKKIRRKKHYLIKFLIVVGIIVCTVVFLRSSFFDIKKIDVKGNDYYSDEEIINMSGASTGRNILFDSGRKQIVEKLEVNPYFREVKVKRDLPKKLIIDVNERKQIAAAVFGNKYVVIDVNGLVLRTAETDPKLTLLSGFTLSRIKEGKKIKAKEKDMLSETLSMVSIMDKGDLYFKRIKVDKTYIRAYIYDTLLVKGTPEQMKRSIERGDLQKVVNKLYKDKIKRGTINLGEHDYISFSPAYE